MEKEKQENPSDILITDQERLDFLLKKYKEQGKDNINVLSDFDRTLTKAIVEGQKAPTVIAQIRQSEYLTSDYVPKAHELYDKYHAIEIDPKVSKKEKIAKMHEWWQKHFTLLVSSGLNKKVMDEIVSKRTLKFRPGALDFIDSLQENNIPLVIMSAGPGDMISQYLKQENRLDNNIHIIANFFEFDKDGKVIKVKEPIIHSLNKKEILVKDYPAFKDVKEKKNVILLGDGVDDIDMIEGFAYDNLIKVGFLNENVDENLPEFKKNFDVIILNDGDMEFVNNILRKII
ncbi:MAG: haloacid dehalogenase-like hydrolase [Candidatus Parcubacteria bacterium]|nr:haloacid dehalogenase-like hydrolase [Candidatus Parcubacteria bacterium]